MNSVSVVIFSLITAVMLGWFTAPYIFRAVDYLLMWIMRGGRA